MQSLASTTTNHSNSNSNNNSELIKGPFDSTTAPPVPGAMNFFPQQGASRRSSDNDINIGTMDDVQFSASLDALLNGEQLAAVATNGTTNSANNNNLYSTTTTTQQPTTLSNSQQFLVSAPPVAPVGAPPPPGQSQQQPQHAAAAAAAAAVAAGQQQQTITLSATQLAGLPLASANQGTIQLVPPGPHSAAQMSLSAGHAAATGGFHPNPAATAHHQAAGLPQIVAATALHHQQPSPFPWAIATTAGAPVPPGSSAPATTALTAPLTTTTTAGPPPPTTPTTTTTLSSGTMKQQQQPQQLQLPPAPTCSSGSKSSLTSLGRGGGGGKRPRSGRDVSAVSEDEGERERRRQDRNLREQQRSHRITEQIAQLREVLSAANLQFKPDKYSTLTKVVEYIKQLQERSKVLDVEHKKLLETISETNEIVNNQYVPAYTSGSDAPSISNEGMGGDGSSSSLDDESMAYVRGIDYKIAFKGCGIPMALASIDGRFLDCNDTFLELTGYTREELLPLEKPGCENTVSFSPDQDDSQKKNLSLFNLLSRDGMDQVFMAMSEMLKRPGSIGTNAAAAKPTEPTTDPNKLADFWSGPVKLCRQDDLSVKLNVTLVRTSRGRPKFFNCALTANRGENELRFDDQTTITTPSQSPSDDTKETNAFGEQPQPLPQPQQQPQQEANASTAAPAAPPGATEQAADPVKNEAVACLKNEAETVEQAVAPVENDGGG